jgi:hypothetical protein
MSVDGIDPHTARLDQLQEILGKDYPLGQVRINAVRASRGVFDQLYCTGPTWLGPLMTPIDLANGIKLPDGTAAEPSARFTNALSTGLFLPAANTMGISAAGVQQATVGPTGLSITTQITSPGDLVINPTGANVDFSGKNLVNVGSITPNPNAYDVIAGGVLQTVDATPLAVLNFPTVPGMVYLCDARVSLGVAATGDSGCIIATARVENYGGVITINAIETTRNYDNPLAAAVVAYVQNGTTIDLQCTGIAATNIKWFAKVSILRCQFV